MKETSNWLSLGIRRLNGSKDRNKPATCLTRKLLEQCLIVYHTYFLKISQILILAWWTNPVFVMAYRFVKHKKEWYVYYNYKNNVASKGFAKNDEVLTWRTTVARRIPQPTLTLYRSIMKAEPVNCKHIFARIKIPARKLPMLQTCRMKSICSDHWVSNRIPSSINVEIRQNRATWGR